MRKKILGVLMLSGFAFLLSGCAALLGAALSAAASYGIYQAAKR